MKYYIIFVVIGLLVWAPQYADSRFLIPLWPFMVVGFVWLIGRFLKERTCHVALVALVIYLSACVFAKHSQRTSDWGYYKEWRTFITETAPPSGFVVASSKPSIYYLSTGCKSARWPYTGDSTRIFQFLSGVDYIVIDRIGMVNYVLPYVQKWTIIAGKDNYFYLLKKP